LEAGEIARDPQVGRILAGCIVGAYVALILQMDMSPSGGLIAFAATGPLGFVALAGARRGSAHEVAFRRLVLTCPLAPEEWFLGRLLGLHALALVYAALVAPALGIVLTMARDPWACALNAVTAYSVISTVAILVGMGFSAKSHPRAPVGAALLVLGLIFTLRVGGILAGLLGSPVEWPTRILVSLLPNAQTMLILGVGATRAPPWTLVIAAVGSIAALLLWTALRHGVSIPSRSAWAVAGCLALVAPLAALTEVARGRGPTAIGDRGIDLITGVPYLVVLALLPLLPGMVRAVSKSKPIR
jgi:hypothetical protein